MLVFRTAPRQAGVVSNRSKRRERRGPHENHESSRKGATREVPANLAPSSFVPFGVFRGRLFFRVFLRLSRAEISHEKAPGSGNHVHGAFSFP